MAMANCRSGPKWASVGFAHEVQVGRKHNSALFRAGNTKRLQRGERVGGTVPTAVDASQGVVADGAAAMEAAHSMGAVISGGQPVRTRLSGRPETTVDGIDHVPDGVLVGCHELDDHRHRLPLTEVGSIVVRR